MIYFVILSLNYIDTYSGETAFHHLMSGFGWAKYPMINRLDSMQKEVPITLIYGSRSWVDRDPGFKILYSRPDSYVDVQVRELSWKLL